VIAYEDFTLPCISDSIKLSWSVKTKQTIDLIESSLNGATLLCGTSYDEVMISQYTGRRTQRHSDAVPGECDDGTEKCPPQVA
jgi:hypothetical protein